MILSPLVFPGRRQTLQLICPLRRRRRKSFMTSTPRLQQGHLADHVVHILGSNLARGGPGSRPRRQVGRSGHPRRHQDFPDAVDLVGETTLSPELLHDL